MYCIKSRKIGISNIQGWNPSKTLKLAKFGFFVLKLKMKIDELADLMGKTREEVEDILKMNEIIELDLTTNERSQIYKDGTQFKIARCVLEEISNGFVKIRGELGTIIINEKNIEKMSRIKVN